MQDLSSIVPSLPPAAAKRLLAGIGASLLETQTTGDSYYSMSCDDLDNLDLSLNIGGQTFKINPEDLDMGAVSSTSNQCVIGIMP